MRPSELSVGTETTLNLRPRDPGRASLFPDTKSNAALSGRWPDCVLTVGKQSALVDGADPAMAVRLRAILDRGNPRVGWLISVEEGTDGQRYTASWREFAEETPLLEPLILSYSDKLVESIRGLLRRASGGNPGQTAPQWLEEEFLISDADPGGNSRALACRFDEREQPTGGFSLIGRTRLLDVERSPDGVWRAVRHRPLKNPKDLKHPPVLLLGAFQFRDETAEAVVRRHKADIERLVADRDSYIAMWREYQKIECENLLRQAGEAGHITYDKARLGPSGEEFLFDVAPQTEEGTGEEKWPSFLENPDENLQIAAVADLPRELREGGAVPSPESLQDWMERRTPKEGLIGNYQFHRDKWQVAIRLNRENQDTARPPKEGVLHVSLLGDAVRLRRRQDAADALGAGRGGIPHLVYLIEDRDPPRIPERRRISRMPQSVRDVFGESGPTPKQVRAIEIAMNTPDFAVIQGPPGTGKTKVIIALQKWIAEEEDESGARGRILSTSYQHDAVENIVQRTEVFGLPALRLGSRSRRVQADDDERRRQNQLDKWRQDKVAELRAALAGTEAPLRSTYRVVRETYTAWMANPNARDHAAATIREVMQLATLHLPAELIIESENVLRHLGGSTSSVRGDLTRIGLEKAARGQRTDPIAFADDGPRQAARLQERLRQAAFATTSEEAEALERAASAPPGVGVEVAVLQQLQRLRGRILDDLVRTERLQERQPIPPEVDTLLVKVLSALRSTIENTPCSKEDALFEFADRLEGDADAASRMIEAYTSVFAATCQQAAGRRVSEAKNLGKDGTSARFDTVIVDEAARANPLDLFIPMTMACRRIVLVGDHRQLPHILDESVERSLQSGATAASREALGKSLFERLFHSLRNREAKDGASRVITLDSQYRMHPRLGEFVSRTFYERWDPNEKIGAGRSEADFPLDVPGFEGRVAAWVSVPGGTGEAKERRAGGGRSCSRRAEARRVAALAKTIMDSAPNLSVGIITFYSGQVAEIQEQLLGLGVLEHVPGEEDDVRCQPTSCYSQTADRNQERFRLGTVDSFQGIEFDVVLLSIVRSNREHVPADPSEARERALWKRYGFLRLENRLCVAMSRQRRLLCVVGDPSMAEGSDAKDAAFGLHSFWNLTGEEPHGTRV